MPTRLQHVRKLYEATLAREPAERAEFLDDACGGDAELRAEVESLLAHREQVSPDFMRPPTPPPGVRPRLVPDGPDPLIGTTVGKYRIKHVIASGGMGTVYLAEQEHPHRDVALKVMRAGIASQSAMRRFEYESEILARLRHPNIAQVYEAGVHQPIAAGLRPGRDDRSETGPGEQSPDRNGGVFAQSIPYFAMEYIPDARPITAFVEENGLTMRARLALFAQVCDAVHHGHQRGIIHRDLKPGNILVDSSGQAKIIDFGVARMTDSDIAVTTMQTGVGALIGTLQYMSPEQCAADPHEIDTRSDVYALGVVLYELLCGQLPYDLTRTPIPVAPRIVCEQAPINPSTIDRRLRGDLEAIVLKALEKDPEKRYASAADLAQDIRRFLNREPIEARPPSIWTHALRWAARHPLLGTAVASVLVGTLTVLATTVSLTWYVNVRPYDITTSDDGRNARLVSIANKRLHVWKDTAGSAHLVERPRELGGGRLAIVGFGQARTDHLRGSLCAFDVDGDLEQPVWSKAIETDDILPPLRADHSYVAEQFAVHDCWVFDVFPDRPGRELVAVYGHDSSNRVIRVYDLAGRLLYQVWHDGSLPKCYWMADAGLLVFAGDCQGPFWDGDQPKGARGKALALLAVRPKLGVIVDDYLRCEPTSDADDPLNPAWHWGLAPAAWADAVERIRLEAPRPPHQPRATVQWTMRVGREGDATIWWVIDQAGAEVPGSRECNDAYKLNRREFADGDERRLPDLNVFRLVPMSEVRPASQVAPDSSAEDAAQAPDAESAGR